MKIRCKECGRIEEANVALFVNIIGGALPAGGFWAWTAYFFAGTGFALPIVIAMISGGVGILVYKEEIVKWITNKGYICKACNSQNWESVI